MTNKLLNNFIRDITSVSPPMSKSEVKGRLEEILASQSENNKQTTTNKEIIEEFRKFWWDNIPEATIDKEFEACKSFLLQALAFQIEEFKKMVEEKKWKYKAKNNEWQNGVVEGRNQVLTELLKTLEEL